MVVAALAVDGGDRYSEENMTSRLFSPNMLTTLKVFMISWICLVPVIANAQAQTAQPATVQSPKGFATPEEAADELIKQPLYSTCRN